ncbi:MAG: hypothetical protein ACREFI_11005 [Stellaceae bacterium]
MRFIQTALRERKQWGPMYRKALTLVWTFVRARADGQDFKGLLVPESDGIDRLAVVSGAGR